MRCPGDCRYRGARWPGPPPPDPPLPSASSSSGPPAASAYAPPTWSPSTRTASASRGSRPAARGPSSSRSPGGCGRPVIALVDPEAAEALAPRPAPGRPGAPRRRRGRPLPRRASPAWTWSSRPSPAPRASPASLEAVRLGKRLALANKESLVVAGPLLTRAARASGAEIVPVDSEHCAIHQCLRAGGRDEVSRLILTASGGPFLGATRERLARVTPAEALAHPTWDMGPRITVDSATLLNKALEVIEARWLFDVPPERIEVVVHPQSVVHSLVEFVDGSVIAQMGPPDMRDARALRARLARAPPRRVAPLRRAGLRAPHVPGARPRALPRASTSASRPRAGAAPPARRSTPPTRSRSRASSRASFPSPASPRRSPRRSATIRSFPSPPSPTSIGSTRGRATEVSSACRR